MILDSRTITKRFFGGIRSRLAISHLRSRGFHLYLIYTTHLPLRIIVTSSALNHVRGITWVGQIMSKANRTIRRTTNRLLPGRITSTITQTRNLFPQKKRICSIMNRMRYSQFLKKRKCLFMGMIRSSAQVQKSMEISIKT